MWDELILNYGQSSKAGRVLLSYDSHLRFHASLDYGVQVNVPRSTFNRLIRQGKIDADGRVLSDHMDEGQKS